MKLYVGNLSNTTNDTTLTELFAPFGSVESAHVITDRDS
ncbi:MAG TPA: RNA-binding protein, partial [Thermoanaerobaculia bacterium]